MKTKKLFFSVIVSILFIILLAACEQEQKTEFVSSDYIIPAGETEDILNIEEPCYIRSNNEAVVTARIEENGDIILTSKGRGNTTVYIGDVIGFSNSARIETGVDETGKINPQITKFDGRAVVPIIKSNVTIGGKVGEVISPAKIDLQMDNTHFNVDDDLDVSSWIINLPTGLSAKIIEIIAVDRPEYPHQIGISVSGTPQSASSEEIKITLPAANAGNSQDVYFRIRTGAKFDITD